MKVYWKMPSALYVSFSRELLLYDQYFKARDLQMAWRHLERAHILGQPWAVEHTNVHWLMLKFGFSIKDRREIIGQIPRLLFGGVKSFVGKIPAGNTGGSKVPPLKPMSIPKDIAELLRPYL